MAQNEKVLFLITARGGSKGIPGKNIKPLAGKPLLCYTIDAAREVVSDKQICLSTDDLNIIQVATQYGLHVPFQRPDELATDTAGSYEVILHAINFYEEQGTFFDKLVLLQPTSPFRRGKDIQNALELYSSDLDMVVSVQESAANPYYNLFEEDEQGYLIKSKTGNFTRRQDCPNTYEFNGAVYVINIQSLKQGSIGTFKKTRKYVMDKFHSVDMDTSEDWLWGEFLLEKGLINLN